MFFGSCMTDGIAVGLIVLGFAVTMLTLGVGIKKGLALGGIAGAVYNS